MLRENASYFPRQRSATVQGADQTVDSIPLTSARSCSWEYVLIRGENVQRGTFVAGWSSDGSSIVTSREATDDVGDCSEVSLGCVLSGSEILFRATTVNEWTIYFRRSRIG